MMRCENGLCPYSGRSSDHLGHSKNHRAELNLHVPARSSTDGFRNLLCSIGVNIDWDTCNRGCFRPCRENIYDVTVTSPGGWPQQSYHKAFYNRFIRHAKFADRFQAYAGESVSDVLKFVFVFLVVLRAPSAKRTYTVSGKKVPLYFCL